MDSDLEIEVGGGTAAAEYIVRVLHAAVGGEPVSRLEIDVADVLRSRGQLEETVLASGVSTRRTVPANEQPVREVGKQLFEALFTGPVGSTYRASLGAARRGDHRLRVVLRLTAPELAALPWEMLFDPETDTYLCRDEPLVRHVAAPYTPDPLPVRPPLRILGLVASPRGLAPLNVEAERQRLADALAGPVADGLVEVTWVPRATWAATQAHLLAGPWHVLHFIGHGDYDRRTEEGLIALVGEDGWADLVEASRLATLLSDADPTPRLVVLNACSSGASGGQDLFAGTAASLVHSGISAVAAMQFAISDPAAIAFARGLYTAIANGRRIDDAVRSGRIAILGLCGSTLEWVTPVLYVRGEAGRLFTFTARPTPPPPIEDRHEERSPGGPSAQDAAKQRAALHALYIEGRAELRLENYAAAIGLFDEVLTLDPHYLDAADLRDTARRLERLASTYTAAVQAEARDDWITAISGYDEVVGIEPAYRDASTRRDACRRRQRIDTLLAELRHHAAAGRWQAVLEVAAQLNEIDPTVGDPDGLATRARDEIESVGKTDELDRRYTEARAAEEAGDWKSAAQQYGDVLTIAPHYRDTAERRQTCQHRTRVAQLTAGLDKRLAADDWPRVLTMVEKLATLDPTLAATSRYTGLAALARRKLAANPMPLRRITALWDINDVSWQPRTNRIAVATNSAWVAVYDWSGKAGVKVKGGSWIATVLSVAFSPDGTRLATGSNNGIARIWEAATGNQLLEIRHGAIVNGVDIGPGGAWLATASADSTACIWDVNTGRKLLEVRHDKAVHCVAFSADGSRLATGSVDGTARIWNTATGKKLLEVRHDKPVPSVAFSPDGSRLATGSADGTARIWNTATGKKLLELRHDKPVPSVAFSPDGSRLATGSADNTARIWDASSGANLMELRHDKPVQCVAFSSNGTRLATGCHDKSVRIWPVG